VDLNIRNVPDDLVAQIKLKASVVGKTLRDFSIGILKSAVDEGVEVTCPMCGLDGPLIRLGTNARCFHCGSGFVPPEGQ
jgi:hypothetical protein